MIKWLDILNYFTVFTLFLVIFTALASYHIVTISKAATGYLQDVTGVLLYLAIVAGLVASVGNFQQKRYVFGTFVLLISLLFILQQLIP